MVGAGGGIAGRASDDLGMSRALKDVKRERAKNGMESGEVSVRWALSRWKGGLERDDGYVGTKKGCLRVIGQGCRRR